MRLLIFTQRVDKNDKGVLGFFHGWVAEFAKNCESVLVVCLYKGDYDLPANVRVLSLGKEEGISRLEYLWRFYKYIIGERKNYDAVFVHMNQVYVLLGGIFWRLWRKPIGFWYAHGKVKLSLKAAVKLANVIFTSTASSFRVKSHKVKIMGQGIDTELFRPDFAKRSTGVFKMITIGRVAPVKDNETLILAGEILAKNGLNFQISIIGEAAVEGDKKYRADMERLILQKGLQDKIKYPGGMANREIVSHLQGADLFVNMSHTGSLDKVIIEAMACGLPVLTCNEAMNDVLRERKEDLMFKKGDFNQLARKISEIHALGAPAREALGLSLRQIAEESHNLKNLIKKIISEFEKK